MTVLNAPVGLDATGQLVPGHPAGLAVWGDTDSSTLVCRQVQEITHDVRTFLFEPERPALFHHEPGQFVTLQLQIDGRPVSRCYTISTPPTRPHLLGITVKRQPGGLVSNWLHDTMTPGTRISADGPFGVFTTARHPSAKYLFLSGGSGITPVMAMTRSLYDLGSDADVVFVHSARTPSDIIFRRELETIASTVPTVRVVPVCERDAPREPWSGLRGFLSIDMLRVAAPDLAERVVFCCGPAPYMAAVRRMLDGAGFDMQNYHEESFSFEDLTMKEFSAFDAPADVDTPSDAYGGQDLLRRVHPQRPHLRVHGGRVRARRGLRRGPEPRVVLRAGHVRHLQDDDDLRHRGHAAQRRHPAPRDRPEQGPDLLLEADERPDDRRLSSARTGDAPLELARTVIAR